MSIKIEVNVNGTEPLVKALNALTDAIGKTNQQGTASKEIQKSSDAVEEAVSKTATKEKEETSKTAVSLEEVRAKLAALTQSGKQAEVKALIKKHGGKKLSDISADKYPDLLKDAEEI
jgi:hypothetical protein